MTDYAYIEDAIFTGLVIFLVAVAFIFEGVCILIFCLSRSRTGRFMKESTPENFRRAKGFYVASIVFTVFIILFTLDGIAGFFDAVINIWEEEDTYYLVWYIVEMAEFALAVTGMVLGICALAAYGKAKALYNRMYPPQTSYYNGNPGQYQQGYPQPTNTQQGYPQPTNTQQGYPQPTNTQQPYPQPTNTPYPQPANTQQSPYDAAPAAPVGPAEPAAPVMPAQAPARTEKMCPACGVVNDGQNKYCVFCGKSME